MTMIFSEWTYDQVRARIIEAAITLRATPAALGPRAKCGSMADVVREFSEAYGYQEETVKRAPPTAEELSRMEITWDWINSYLNEEQRKFVYDYGFIKTRRGRTIAAYLNKIGMERRTFDRRIQEYCQIIADRLNQKHAVRFTVPLDAVSQIIIEEQSSTVSSDICERNATHWIDERPQFDHALPRVRVIDPRAIRARRKSKGKARKAKQPA